MITEISINGLRLLGFHGVGEQERVVGNIFEYDITLRYPFMQAAMDDDLSATINYADVVSVVEKINSEPSKLLENVAWRLRCALLDRWPEIQGGEIRVTKTVVPIPADLGSASVRITL